MKNTKFYICNHCGNVITKIHDAGVPVVCCGEKMTELVPGTVEASREKHIPEVSVRCGKVSVNVGSVEHPMSEEHSILWGIPRDRPRRLYEVLSTHRRASR